MWLTHTWNEMWSHMITMAELTPNIKLEKENDIFLVESFSEDGIKPCQM